MSCYAVVLGGLLLLLNPAILQFFHEAYIGFALAVVIIGAAGIVYGVVLRVLCDVVPILICGAVTIRLDYRLPLRAMITVWIWYIEADAFIAGATSIFLERPGNIFATSTTPNLPNNN